MSRCFLLLQGPCTPFFTQLSKRLRQEGHTVYRINLCAGDALYANDGSSWNFRGKRGSFETFLLQRYKAFGITDQILFGDCRPLHKIATTSAKTSGVRSHVFEEGYFRPYWITLEREGVNAHSLLPKDPQWYKETSLKLPQPNPVEHFRSSFRTRTMHDIIYHVAGIANPLLYPHFRTHAPFIAPIEYLGYIKRFTKLRMIKKYEQERVQTLITKQTPYFVLPLQLNSDAQIREHSDFKNMREVIDYVARSFANHAPSHCHLVLKNHPLDMGLMPYTSMIQEIANHYDLTGRIHFFEDGDLTTLFKNALGVVTVNSTSGMVSLEHNIPTITLSDPIYNVEGLTFQASLDDFWCNHVPPNTEFFKQFKRVVIHTTQINGGFYCPTGIALAVENAIHSLVADKSPLEMLL